MKRCFYVILLFFIVQCGVNHAVTYISLGAACGPALNLRNLNLRTAAYPFDWIVSPFDGLCKALEDDFADFLTDLRLRPDHGGVIDAYGFQFTHDWPTLTQSDIDAQNIDYVNNGILFQEWEQVLPLVMEKYQRRIERFRNACLSTEKIIFIREGMDTQENAIILRDIIRKKYPDLNFRLIVTNFYSRFQEPWNIEGIYNFYVRWDDTPEWEKLLRTVVEQFGD